MAPMRLEVFYPPIEGHSILVHVYTHLPSRHLHLKSMVHRVARLQNSSMIRSKHAMLTPHKDCSMCAELGASKIYCTSPLRRENPTHVHEASLSTFQVNCTVQIRSSSVQSTTWIKVVMYITKIWNSKKGIDSDVDIHSLSRVVATMLVAEPNSVAKDRAKDKFPPPANESFCFVRILLKFDRIGAASVLRNR